MGLVIAVGALIVAPLMTIAIKVAARFVPFIPRNDTYNRVLLSLLPPFAGALVGGWPHLAPSIASAIATLTAILSPALFIYLFRSEIKEWGSTVGAGVAGLFVGWFLAGFVATIVASATGPLYADMLPAGPWKSFATGVAPLPAPKTEVAAATSAAPTTLAATEAAPEPLTSAPTPTPAATPGSAQAIVTRTPTPHDTHTLFTPSTPTPDAGAYAGSPTLVLKRRSGRRSKPARCP